MQANRKVTGSLPALLLAAGLTAGSACAQGVGGGLRLGTPGLGLEVESLVGERFGIRGLVNGPASYSYDDSSIRYDGKFRLGTRYLLADWHPYATGFRLSGGLAYNGSNYASAQVGSLDGRVLLSRASPYLGVGWGVGWGLTPRTGSRLYFSADLGVTYQRPSAALTSSCGIAVPAGVCAQLHGDLRADEAEFRDTADDLRFNPVISVGFGLRF